MSETDRYLGCILGLAIGDALGYPVEFDRSPHVTDMSSPLYSDDTQMSIATAEGIIAGGTLEDVHRAYLKWLATQSDPSQRRAPGNTCISALTSGRMGTIEKPLNSSKGCGGVMRVAPAGLVCTPEIAFRKGAEYAALTHGHPTGYLSAGFLAELISRLVEAEPLDEAIYKCHLTLEKCRDSSQVNSAFFRADTVWGNNWSVKESVRALGEGWVAEEALAISLFCALRFKDNFKAGVLAGVNHAGDSDSTGCITGAILGTLLGIEAIPSTWVESVENSRSLKELAERLAAMGRSVV